MRKRKAKRYQFIEKKAAAGGKLSLILGAVSVLLFLACLLTATFSETKASGLGGVCFVAAAFAIYGFVAGMRSFYEKDTEPQLSIIGSILCGLSMVGWILVFLSGLQ